MLAIGTLDKPELMNLAFGGASCIMKSMGFGEGSQKIMTTGNPSMAMSGANEQARIALWAMAVFALLIGLL